MTFSISEYTKKYFTIGYWIMIAYTIILFIDSEYKECFYNITDDFVEQVKKELVYQAKDQLKWSFIAILGSIFVSFIH